PAPAVLCLPDALPISPPKARSRSHPRSHSHSRSRPHSHSREPVAFVSDSNSFPSLPVEAKESIGRLCIRVFTHSPPLGLYFKDGDRKSTRLNSSHVKI